MKYEYHFDSGQREDLIEHIKDLSKEGWRLQSLALLSNFSDEYFAVMEREIPLVAIPVKVMLNG